MEQGKAEGLDPEMNEKELAEQLKAYQQAQMNFLQQEFQWLIQFVASYFPGDQLAMEDAGPDVHFIHKVVVEDKNLGALVYRFRKIMDKKGYFAEVEAAYREEMEVPEVLFVDTETQKFTAPETLETDGNYVEIPPEKLTGKIRELREEIKKRFNVKQLRESV